MFQERNPSQTALSSEFYTRLAGPGDGDLLLVLDRVFFAFLGVFSFFGWCNQVDTCHDLDVGAMGRGRLRGVNVEKGQSLLWIREERGWALPKLHSS